MQGDFAQFNCGLGRDKACQFWPAKFVFGILEKSLELGSLQVHTQTKVIREAKVESRKGYSVKYEIEEGAKGSITWS